jgi:hypothetical protein
VGPRVGLDGRKSSSPTGFDPGPQTNRHMITFYDKTVTWTRPVLRLTYVACLVSISVVHYVTLHYITLHYVELHYITQLYKLCCHRAVFG